MTPKTPMMTMLIVAGNDYLKILIALMIPKTPIMTMLIMLIMTMLIIDGNDIDFSTTQLLAPVVKALDLVAEKSCGSQGWKFQSEKFGSSANTNLEDSGLKMGNF